MNSMKEGLRLLTAMLSPNCLVRTIDPKHQSISDDDRFLASALIQDRRASILAGIYSSLASPGLPVQQRLGAILLGGLIIHADDIFDCEEAEILKDHDLESYFLTRTFPSASADMKVGDILRRILDCYPTGKQEKLLGFFDEMTRLHVRESHKGEAGTYCLSAARHYKDLVNYRCLAIGAFLVEADSWRVKQYSPAFLAVQMLDDYTDWFIDGKGGQINMFLGTATDVWQQRLDPLGEDISFLHSFLGHDQLLTKKRALMIAKNPHLRHTRQAYQVVFKQITSEIGIPYLKIAIETLGNIVLS